MADYKLQKDDFTFIREILKNNEEIRNIYSYLSLLEREGKKNHPDYRMTLARLSRFLMVEKALYDGLENDYERIVAIMNFLVIRDQINNFGEDLKIVVDGDKSSQIKRRIINNLNILRINEDVAKLYELSNSFEKEKIELGKNELDNYYDILGGSIEYISKIKEDYLSTLLSLSSEDTDLKYRLSFVFNFCEKKLLPEKFEIKEKLYWYSEMFADFKELPDFVNKPCKDLFGIPFYAIFSEYEKDSKRKDEWDYIKRVSLLYMKEEDVLKIEKDENILKLHKTDIEKPIITSFKRRGNNGR